MRKIRLLLSLFILLVFISPNSFADNNKTIYVSMNGNNVQVREVPIILNGQSVVLEDPSFILIDRTLVPLRFVAESFGAEVDWVQKTKTAIVTHNNKKINLTIDSPDVTINQDKYLLDKNSIPKLVTFANKNDAKTMVPIAFISTILGFEVGYDEVTRQPFINAAPTPEEETDDEVVELAPETDVDKDKDENKDEENEENKEEEKKEEPLISKEEMENLNVISDIYLDYINGKDVIVVEGTKDAKYNVTRISNPERVVIDILDSAFAEGVYFEYKYDIAFVKGIRASQYSGDKNYPAGQRIVRVVLDAKDGEMDPNVNVVVEDGKLLIFPKKSIWENINYDSISNIMSILTTEPTIYNISYDTITKSVEIVIPSGFDQLDEDKVKVLEGLVDQIEITKNPVETRIKIQFTRSIEFQLLSDPIDNEIVFSFKRVNNTKPSDLVIVIDPGHGGKDNGASSKSGVREKDLNLIMGLKLETALKQLGYNIVMTRTTDVYYGLYERPAFANSINADMFISMHANSTTNPAVNGIEVLYCPATPENIKSVDQYPLAKLVMEEVLKATGGKERRIHKRPDLVVLNRTNMPAILVETGFMSNVDELRLIMDETYQNNFIKGIVNGVDRYFDLY